MLKNDNFAGITTINFLIKVKLFKLLFLQTGAVTPKVPPLHVKVKEVEMIKVLVNE